MSGTLVGNDPLKGWLMGALGLFVAQIGQEGLYAYDRFTFGFPELSGGIALIPALIGAFGFAEILTTLANPVEHKLLEMRDSIRPRFDEVARYWRTVGLMAAETGDMSSIPGHMIPMLALGVPGSAPSAVLMAAIIIHGIQAILGSTRDRR